MAHSKKTSISVGLFTIPIRLEVAVDEESSGYRTICTGLDDTAHDPIRVKSHVDCPTCGVSHSSVWGYPNRAVERDGKLIQVTAEEIKAAAGEPIKVMTVSFHAREKVYAATVAADSVQNAFPDKGGEKGYAALCASLQANPDVVGVTVWAPGTANALWVLEVVDGRIVASKRAWPENVRPAPAIAPAEVTEVEQQMLDLLVTTSVRDFDVTEYRNAAREGIEHLIASRAGEAIAVPVGTAAPVAGGDMLAALQATLDALAPAKPAPAKKAAAKKAATPRKRAAKKTTAPTSVAS